MKASAKRVLVVAHDFPPHVTSGVYRVTGLTKYLCPLGWTPTVLAAERRGSEEDPTLLRKVPPEVEIVRAPSPRLASWEEPASRALKGLGALHSQNNGHRQRIGDAWLRRSGNLLRSCAYFPDEMVAWVPFAIAKAIQLHRRKPFDMIYTSGPPRSSAMVGALLQPLLGVPWVLEFRDPWYPSPRPMRRRFEGILQKFLLKRADAVVVVTEGYAEELRNKWGVPAEKLTMIRNGFDEDDFRDERENETEVLPREYFHLSHFGTIYEGHSGKFFTALKELATERPDLTCLLRVNIIGFPDEQVSRQVNDPQLKPLVRMQGFVSHKEALQNMRATDGLLLFLADPNFSRMAVSGKTYEYLRIGRPILAVTSSSEIEQLLSDGKAGWVARPDDIAGIKQILQLLLLGFQAEGHRAPKMQPEFVAQFRYDCLGRKLTCVFDKVTNHVR